MGFLVSVFSFRNMSPFFVASTAFDSLHVADAEEKPSISLPGPIVQWRASNKAAVPQERSHQVRKFSLTLDRVIIIILLSHLFKTNQSFYADSKFIVVKNSLLKIFLLIFCQILQQQNGCRERRDEMPTSTLTCSLPLQMWSLFMKHFFILFDGQSKSSGEISLVKFDLPCL